MAIVLRFVDIDWFLRERFFAIVNVADTTAATLKKEISDALGRYDLHIHNMRGQGYDGASNMCGSWNGLQSLFLNDCSCAYYLHCFAHRLQLALIAAAEKDVSIWLFFSKLYSICNQIDVFVAAIDFQIEELNSSFKDEAVELLKLSCALEPKDNFKLLNVDHIYQLAEKLYHLDFDAQDLHHLRTQLAHDELGMPVNERFQNLSTISELCRRLVETNKSRTYNLIDRIRLVLTLPVSIATTERAFSAMKLVKTILRNKMEEDF